MNEAHTTSKQQSTMNMVTSPATTEPEQSLAADTSAVQSTSSQPSTEQSLSSAATTPSNQSPSQSVQVSVTTTSGTTTTFLETTTTSHEMTETESPTTDAQTTDTQESSTNVVTSQQTPTSDQSSSELTTVTQYIVTSSPAPDVHCCCRCCFPSTQMCKVCDGNSLTDASECANEEPKTVEPVDRNTPKFAPPFALEGSKHPERLEYRADFLKSEQLTETLATLPETQKIDLGFKCNDLIVDCSYDGSPCSVEQLVLFVSLHREQNAVVIFYL